MRKGGKLAPPAPQFHCEGERLSASPVLQGLRAFRAATAITSAASFRTSGSLWFMSFAALERLALEGCRAFAMSLSPQRHPRHGVEGACLNQRAGKSAGKLVAIGIDAK